MSLVPTWVKATDGLFYKNPILYGEDWYICFDDDDPPELVISNKIPSSKAALTVKAEKILTELGIKFKLHKHPRNSGRMFPPTWKKCTNSLAFFFDLESLMPIPQLSDDKAEKWKGECVIYGKDF